MTTIKLDYDQEDEVVKDYLLNLCNTLKNFPAKHPDDVKLEKEVKKSVKVLLKYLFDIEQKK